MKKVLIKHISDGKGNLILTDKSIVRNVKSEYKPGHYILDSTGEPWKVKKSSVQEYETI